MDDKILHQDAVEEVVDDHLGRASDQTALTDLTAAVAVGSSFVQAEVNAVVTKVNAVITQQNAILGVLRDANLLPSA